VLLFVRPSIILKFLFTEIEWSKLYQKPSKSKEAKSQLMLRPHFPPIYRESEMPDAISEVVVIVLNVWKVGHLVDWLTDGCYWSGRIIEILGNEKVKVIFLCYRPLCIECWNLHACYLIILFHGLILRWFVHIVFALCC
jgi:hypothetical protein